MDPRYDQCVECGGESFVLHFNEWERTCENCGLVSCIEFSIFEPPVGTKTYKKHSYFRNTIINNAIKAGAPINGEEAETLAGMFDRCVSLFHENKESIKRNNFPSSQFVLWKLGEIIGKDLKQWCKLPKLKSTLAKVELDWEFINPRFY